MDTGAHDADARWQRSEHRATASAQLASAPPPVLLAVADDGRESPVVVDAVEGSPSAEELRGSLVVLALGHVDPSVRAAQLRLARALPGTASVGDGLAVVVEHVLAWIADAPARAEARSVRASRAAATRATLAAIAAGASLVLLVATPLVALLQVDATARADLADMSLGSGIALLVLLGVLVAEVARGGVRRTSGWRLGSLARVLGAWGLAAALGVLAAGGIVARAEILDAWDAQLALGLALHAHAQGLGFAVVVTAAMVAAGVEPTDSTREQRRLVSAAARLRWVEAAMRRALRDMDPSTRALLRATVDGQVAALVGRGAISRDAAAAVLAVDDADVPIDAALLVRIGLRPDASVVLGPHAPPAAVVEALIGIRRGARVAERMAQAVAGDARQGGRPWPAALLVDPVAASGVPIATRRPDVVRAVLWPVLVAATTVASATAIGLAIGWRVSIVVLDPATPVASVVAAGAAVASVAALDLVERLGGLRSRVAALAWVGTGVASLACLGVVVAAASASPLVGARSGPAMAMLASLVGVAALALALRGVDALRGVRTRAVHVGSVTWPLLPARVAALEFRRLAAIAHVREHDAAVHDALLARMRPALEVAGAVGTVDARALGAPAGDPSAADPAADGDDGSDPSRHARVRRGRNAETQGRVGP